MSCDNFLLEALDGNCCSLRRMGGRCNVCSTLCTHWTLYSGVHRVCSGENQFWALRWTAAAKSVAANLWQLVSGGARESCELGDQQSNSQAAGIAEGRKIHKTQYSRLGTEHYPHLSSQNWVRGNNLGHGTSSLLHSGDCWFSVRHTASGTGFSKISRYQYLRQSFVLSIN